MNGKLNNNNEGFVFGDEPAKKEIAVAGETAVSTAGEAPRNLCEMYACWSLMQ